MMFNKAFRVCVMACSLSMGLMGCDNEGTGGSGPSLSASSGGADPGSLSGDTGRGQSFSGQSTQSGDYGETQAPPPGVLSADPDVPSSDGGSSGGGGGGGSCSLATACDDYKKALTNFVRRACAQAGAQASQCESALEEGFGEFDAECRAAISSGEATPAQVCEALDCVSCFFDQASISDAQGDFCTLPACQSQCRNVCADQVNSSRI